MIMKQDIYISEWLEKDYKVVYDQLIVVLADLRITPKILSYLLCCFPNNWKSFIVC